MAIDRMGLRRLARQAIINSTNLLMRQQNPNSHLPVCWLHFLVCPRRYLAVLPSKVRPNLFGSD
jgi:hypothetical protein